MQIQAPYIFDYQQHAPTRDLLKHVRTDSDWASLDEVMCLLRYMPPLRPSDSGLRFRRRSVRAGQALYDMEQPFNGLYVVKNGSFKSVLRQEDGSENVISFSMGGDLLGMDGVCKDYYHCEATALSDSDVIRVPSDGLFSNGRKNDDVERMIYWAISREISREMEAYAVGHSSKSEVRVARFLVSQSDRFSKMGCSPTRFTLPMTRREIGSYLNVTLETVSRALTSLHQLGIIDVSIRNITIHSMENLRNYEG